MRAKINIEDNQINVDYSVISDRELDRDSLKLELTYNTGKIDKYDEPEWESEFFTYIDSPDEDDISGCIDGDEDICTPFFIAEKEIEKELDFNFMVDLQDKFGGKYTDHGLISLRIADHSPNADKNIPENDIMLNVLIVRHDPTSDKFGAGNYFSDYRNLDIREVMSLKKAESMIDDEIKKLHEYVFDLIMKGSTYDNYDLENIFDDIDDVDELNSKLGRYLNSVQLEQLQDKLFNLGLIEEKINNSFLSEKLSKPHIIDGEVYPKGAIISISKKG